MRLYYAQNREDLLIKGFFPDVKQGFYVDVGANDPIIDSVTKLLYDSGWSGVNIEPIAKHFAALEDQRSRDINLNIGLSDKTGELTFHEYPEGDGLSTFDQTMADFYKDGGHSFPTTALKEYTVPVKTLDDVIREQSLKHVHFIKIDVEGYEYEVIQGYGWSTIRPELICIEANHITEEKDWRPLLRTKGYELVFFDGVNNYYLAKESLFRKGFFNYPDLVFSGNPIYFPAFLETQQIAEESFLPKQQVLLDKIGDQEEQIAVLHRQQRDVRFLAKRLVEELQIRLNRRAKGTAAQAGLMYESDERIREAVGAEMDKETMLQFIHERDKKNIGKQRRSLSGMYKTLMWRLSASILALTVVIMKKAGRRVMYGRTR